MKHSNVLCCENSKCSTESSVRKLGDSTERDQFFSKKIGQSLVITTKILRQTFSRRRMNRDRVIQVLLACYFQHVSVGNVRDFETYRPF